MEGFQPPKSGDTSNKDDRPKAARKATPHVPTNWWKTKTSSDFPRRVTGMVMSCGFVSYDDTRGSLHHHEFLSPIISAWPLTSSSLLQRCNRRPSFRTTEQGRALKTRPFRIPCASIARLPIFRLSLEKGK